MLVVGMRTHPGMVVKADSAAAGGLAHRLVIPVGLVDLAAVAVPVLMVPPVVLVASVAVVVARTEPLESVAAQQC